MFEWKIKWHIITKGLDFLSAMSENFEWLESNLKSSLVKMSFEFTPLKVLNNDYCAELCYHEEYE